MRPLVTIFCLVVFIVGIPSTFAADLPLLDHPTTIPTTDAKVSITTENVLHVTTGHSQPWPGIRIVAPHEHWDLSAFEYVEADARNVGVSRLTLRCRVDNPGSDGATLCDYGSVTLEPGKSAPIKVPIGRSSPLRQKLFGMMGLPIGPATPPIDPANVNQLLFYVERPAVDHAFELNNIHAGGTYTETDPEHFFPFIDTFGQYTHRDWPGKIHSLQELTSARDAEEKDLAAHPAPAAWDKFGGDASGPTLAATGFFHTQKIDGKWWLIDPDGKRFFSQGIDCVGELNDTPIDQRDNWFDNLPLKDPAFAEFFHPARALLGHYAATNPRCFNFAAANLKRKYGDDWKTNILELSHRRLRSWGINTIGNWSDAAVKRMDRTPYVATLNVAARNIAGSAGYWGQFPDPFDPAFAASADRSINRGYAGAANDPWCIGCFVGNEMSWGNETSLAIATLKSPPDQPAKLAFLADLKTRYGTIEKLNSAWGTAHASWDDLLAARTAPDARKAADDLKAFYSHLAETYFRTVRDAVKKSAPQQLYLGCRFASSNAVAVAAAAKYCDVVSFNLYRPSVAEFVMPGGAVDVPLIIGEFHFGALDRGPFHPGLVPTKDQTARAQAYTDYVRGALKHPQFVGCHWFEFRDEPATGRVLDGENYQIGFTDVADTPYPEIVAAAREMGSNMYKMRNER